MHFYYTYIVHVYFLEKCYLQKISPYIIFRKTTKNEKYVRVVYIHEIVIGLGWVKNIWTKKQFEKYQRKSWISIYMEIVEVYYTTLSESEATYSICIWKSQCWLQVAEIRINIMTICELIFDFKRTSNNYF